jgi:oligopeptide transport system permease protein
MFRFLAWRLVQSVLVLWAVYTVTFFLLMLTPGDPFISSEKKAPQGVREALAGKYGLKYLALPDEQRKALSPGQKLGYITQAYAFYLGHALTGDFGPSIEYENWSVRDIIASSLPVSLTLGSVALLLALWGGVAAGTFGAVRKNRLPDIGLSIVTLLGVSLPSFVVGSLLIMAFVVILPIMPVGGWGSGGTGGGAGFFQGLARLILPALTLALFFLAYIARLTRSSMIDTLSADFVRTARSKGLRPSRIVTHHVGANAILPVLSYLGPAAANILVGSFVVEKLFVIPGLGQHFVNGCLNKDIPLVLGAVMVYSAMVVVFNLLVDLAYAAVDPRITLSG